MATKTVKEATQAFENIAADTQTAAKEQFDKLGKGVEQAVAFGQENMDAVVKSSEVAMKAAEGFNAEVTAFSKKSFEDTVAAAKDLTTAKSATDYFEKQATFAKTSFEGFMAQATKMNELFTSTAKEVSAPLNARVSAAQDMAKTFTA